MLWCLVGGLCWLEREHWDRTARGVWEGCVVCLET